MPNTNKTLPENLGNIPSNFYSGQILKAEHLNSISSALKKAESIITKNGDIDNKIDEVNTTLDRKITNINTDISTINSKITTITKDGGTIDSKIDEAIESLTTDVGTIQGVVEAVQSLNANLQNESHTVKLNDVENNNPLGLYSTTEGQNTKTGVEGVAAHAEGNLTYASGEYSHAEGDQTEAYWHAHAEGYLSYAYNAGHAEGRISQAIGKGAHAEGLSTYTPFNPMVYLYEVPGITDNEILVTASTPIPDSFTNCLDSLEAEDRQTFFIDLFHPEAKTKEDGTTTYVSSDVKKVISVSIEDKTNSIYKLTLSSKFEAPNWTKESHDYLNTEFYLRLHTPVIAKGQGSHAEGAGNIVTSFAGHVEGGENIVETSYYGHAEGCKTKVTGMCGHAEGRGTQANGIGAHAEGGNYYGGKEQPELTKYGKTIFGSCAGGDASHAEGFQTLAIGNFSHTEGYQTYSSHDRGHAEGYKSEAKNYDAHAEGVYTIATGHGSHSEGLHTYASGAGSHVEGYGYFGNIIITEYKDENKETKYSVTTDLSDWRKGHIDYILSQTTTRFYKDGTIYKADGPIKTGGNYSSLMDIGYLNPGTYTVISMMANGIGAHAEGISTIVGTPDSGGSAPAAHAEGYYTKALHEGSHVEGHYTESARTYQHVQGQWNDPDSKKIHIVGWGTSNTDRKNIHTIDTYGNAAFAGTVSPAGADYAEMFEWQDGNTSSEDRIGLLVTLNEDKIALAQENDEVIGIVTGTASVIGDNQEMNWQGKYVTDEFGRKIYQDVEIYDSEGNVIGTEKQEIISENYDATETYIPRSKRPEWSTIGLVGKMYLRDDGTCLPGKYAKPLINGLATYSDEKTNIRVMKRTSDNIIYVLLK